MDKKIAAFSEKIEDGLVRVLITIDTIECSIENDAPDFINIEDDQPVIKVFPESKMEDSINIFQKSFSLKLNERKSECPVFVYDLEAGGIWVDLEMDKVKDIWVTDFNFYIESKNERYISYHIKSLNHKLEWLQEDKNSGEIKSISEYKKKYTPPNIKETELFTGSDILKCTDMLARAIRKIDLRSGGALVKFNTEEGRLESLIIGMSDRLGYNVAILEKDEIKEAEKNGRNVSHSIHLKSNY